MAPSRIDGESGRGTIVLIRKAVTVDWVVLTAGAIGISLAALSGITNGTKTLTETISSTVGSQTIMQSF